LEIIMARVSSLDVVWELKEQRKLERAAQKEQKSAQTKETGTQISFDRLKNSASGAGRHSGSRIS
jgi:hypothetical protein